jgi:hypothetical protein
MILKDDGKMESSNRRPKEEDVAMQVANPDIDVTMMVAEEGDADVVMDIPVLVIRLEPGFS